MNIEDIEFSSFSRKVTKRRKKKQLENIPKQNFIYEMDHGPRIMLRYKLVAIENNEIIFFSFFFEKCCRQIHPIEFDGMKLNMKKWTYHHHSTTNCMKWKMKKKHSPILVITVAFRIRIDRVRSSFSSFCANWTRMDDKWIRIANELNTMLVFSFVWIKKQRKKEFVWASKLKYLVKSIRMDQRVEQKHNITANSYEYDNYITFVSILLVCLHIKMNKKTFFSHFFEFSVYIRLWTCV